jgi:LCP family protein required for cell wall assembly
MFERLDPEERFSPDGGFRAAVLDRGRHIRRRRHRIVGGALASVVVAVAAVGVTAGWSREKWKDVERVDVQGLPPEVDAVDGEPFTVLVAGVDGPRVDAPEVAGLRSDTLMAVRVEPSAQRVEVTSIPRDLWVEIPGHGEQRINQALELGGAPLLVDTVESALGIDVDRYLQIDFDGFRDLVDLAGGVELDFPHPARSPSTGLAIAEAGCHRLDGTQALALVRVRRDLQWAVDGTWQLDISGDLGRMQRQQVFGRAVVGALGDLGSDPVERARLLDVFADHVTMDTYWTREQLESLVDLAGRLDPTEIVTGTVPVVDAVRGEGAQVLLPAEPGEDAGPPAYEPAIGPC